MSHEEKRIYYKNTTKKEAVTLDEIPTWIRYWKNNYKKEIKKGSKPENEDRNKQDSLIAEKISIWNGDITSLQVDVIVNAANRGLQGGGGGAKKKKT